MKRQSPMKTKIWAIAVGLVIALVYSVLALSMHTVYAATCNCSEEVQDAAQYCSAHYGAPQLTDFTCPFNGDNYNFVCINDPHHTFHTIPCD